jgi:hypothetical protein
MIGINILKTKKAVLVAFTLLMAGASGASLAGPIVTSWEYVNDAVFSSAEFTEKIGFDAFRGTTKHTDYELSWGGDGASFEIGGDRSAVTIGNGTAHPVTLTGGGPATGTVNTIFGDGPPTDISEIGIGINISHWNNSISVFYDELLSGTLFDSLTLTPTTGGSTVNLSPLEFNFKFLETTNYPSSITTSGTCPGGTPEPCDDLFGIVGIPNLNPRFEYDGRNYQTNILLTDGDGGVAPIGILLDGECGALDLGDRCLGWRTKEAAITTVQFGFTIRAIPEPSTLILFGIGLAGLGYRRYKARAA